MAHGNISDLVFLVLIGVVVQWLAFPATLFQDLGPFKAQFAKQSADMDAIIKFGAGLLLMIGMTFSGVKWNPINGKMGGFAGIVGTIYVAYSEYKNDNEVFIPRLIYVYAAVLLLGSLHICVLPSNPLPPKSPETKNNHGNFSDMAALPLIVAALLCLFYPAHLFQDFGPIKAQFSTETKDLSTMIKFVGVEILMIGLTLSGVKWNPINGKMAGLGGFVAAGYTAFSTFKADADVFVPRLFYIYCLLISLGSLHIFAFPSNALPPKEDAKKNSGKKKKN